MKKYIVFLFFMILNKYYTQTTNIPDPNFEQALIDLNIDSDGTVNGEVFTSDIANVEELNISELNITDITGIENFSSLKILNFSFTPIGANSYPFTLDLTALENLEELYMNSDGDNSIVAVSHLDVSNNPQLRKVESRHNWILESINLTGSDIQINDIIIDLYKDLTVPVVCIQVSYPTQAANGQGNYANWQLNGNYSFTNNCSLRTKSFSKNQITIYPNPVNDIFYVNSNNSLIDLKIYTIQGKLVKHFETSQTGYSVSKLSQGIYLVEIMIENQKEKQIKKIVVD